jgi:hypothetical protein
MARRSRKAQSVHNRLVKRLARRGVEYVHHQHYRSPTIPDAEILGLPHTPDLVRKGYVLEVETCSTVRSSHTRKEIIIYYQAGYGVIIYTPLTCVDKMIRSLERWGIEHMVDDVRGLDARL